MHVKDIELSKRQIKDNRSFRKESWGFLMYFASCKITLEIKLLYTQKNTLQVVLLCLSWLTKLTSSVPITGTSRQNCKQLYFLREERGSGLRFVLFIFRMNKY